VCKLEDLELVLKLEHGVDPLLHCMLPWNIPCAGTCPSEWFPIPGARRPGPGAAPQRLGGLVPGGGVRLRSRHVAARAAASGVLYAPGGGSPGSGRGTHVAVPRHSPLAICGWFFFGRGEGVRAGLHA